MGSGELLFINSRNTRTERNLKLDGTPDGGELLTLAVGGSGDRQHQTGSKRGLSNS